MRLPSCDKWHKGKESMISTRMVTDHRSGKAYKRFICKLCANARRLHPQKRQALAKPKLYGVIPLTWRPPEL